MCGDGCAEVVDPETSAATLTPLPFDPDSQGENRFPGEHPCLDICPDRTGDCPGVCDTGIGACGRLAIIGEF